MKLKQIPEDFVVEEVLKPQYAVEGKYSFYGLKKKSLDTLEAKRIIIRKFKVPYLDIGVAGLKDKHAKTTQYITISGREGSKYNFKKENITLTFLGYVDKPLKSGDLLKNKFTITIREITQRELPKIMRTSEEVKQFGVPNYFDSQRFGSLKGTDDFVAKHLLFDDFESALKTYMTRRTGFERALVGSYRREILQSWGNWKYLLEKCRPVAKLLREEYRVIEYLAQNGQDYIGAFRILDKAIKELFVSAYQSYLWNECVKLFLRQKVHVYDLPYAAGTLFFYKTLPLGLLEQWKKVTLPLLSHKTNPSPEIKQIIDKVVQKEGISLRDLKIRKMTALFFKERPRALLLFPENLEASNPVHDELNKGFVKITMAFTLEKGAYATVVLKRIFNGI